jgi:hypothetical protein
MYIYKTTIYKPARRNIVDDDIRSINQASQDDFEANYKASAVLITSVVMAETTFITELAYADFKAKIVSPITWADVKYIDNNDYVLYLASEVPI